MPLLSNLFRKARVERDLDAEMRVTLQQIADENLRRGMSPAQAQRAAAMEFGGLDQVAEQVRDARRGRLLDELARDLRYAARTLAKSPGFTAVALLALTLGIGANTAMFSVVYGVLLRPLPYPDAHRIAVVYMNWRGRNNPRANLSVADYLDWTAQNHAFENPSLYGAGRFDVTGLREPEQIEGSPVTPGVFTTLRVHAMLGRLFLPGEEKAGAPPLAIIGESLWRRRFNGSPDILGQSIVLNGAARTIVGVMPGDFHFPRRDSEVWTNLEIKPPTRHGPYLYRAIGRLKPGVTLDAAQREADAIGRRIEQENPRLYSRLHLPVETLPESIVGSVRTALLVMIGAVGLVLLIAVVNVANLTLARATVREREMALRLSLGANRARLVRQLLTESVLLASAGGAAGLAFAYAAIRLLRALNPSFLPRVQEVHVDAVALAFTIAAALLTGVLFGLVPALQSARADLNSTLKEGGRTGGSGSHRRTRAALVVAEVALSLMLLVGAGLLLRSLERLQAVDAGFHASPRQVISLGLSPAPPANDQRLLNRIRRLPGVQSAALSDGLPPDQEADADTFTIPGQVLGADQRNPVVSVGTVTADYFRALGIPLRRGRFFDDRDTAAAPPVTIVSENMARRFFPGVDPIGRRMQQSGAELNNPPMEIVGVVGNVRYAGLQRGADSTAAYYLPYGQNSTRRGFLVVRTAGDAAPLGPVLRREVQALDPGIVITSLRTLEQDVASSIARPRFDAWLLGSFAGLALLMAVIGIYGVIAYSVAQRTHEIGVRMALGAGRATVVAMVLRQAAGLAATGILLGLAGAFALTRLLEGLLFGTSATDTLTFAAVAAGLFSVALAAGMIPAHRATRISPVVALRA